MEHHLTRRRFLATSAAAGLGLAAAGRLEAAKFETTLHKALIGPPNEETLASWKAAGFEGMEANKWNATPEEAKAAREIAEKLDMRIHAVLRGWTNFNSPDAGKVAADVESVETALKAAAGYGADAILLVPCRVGGMAMPQPWEFDIEFDEKTGHVTRVAAGDNAPYADYIAAQNHATDASRKALEKLIPTAEKTGVVIAVENVWNNLWVKPALFAHFVASFDCPWVQAYFDIGNHVKYAMPEEWIRALAGLIVKCHVKDFRLNPDGHGGRFVDIRDGSVDWPLVRKELDKIGYNGWMTIEGSGGLSLEERNKRLDLIVAGK
jgi:hexulose-6-phosphate isomerase